MRCLHWPATPDDDSWPQMRLVTLLLHRSAGKAISSVKPGVDVIYSPVPRNTIIESAQTRCLQSQKNSSVAALVTLCFRLFAIRSNKTITAGSGSTREQQLGWCVVSGISSNFMCKGRVLLSFLFLFNCPVSAANRLQSLMWRRCCLLLSVAGFVGMQVWLCTPPCDDTYAPSSQFTDLWAWSPISTASCLQHWDLVWTWLFVRYWPPPGIGSSFFLLKLSCFLFLTPRRSPLLILIPDWLLKNIRHDNSQNCITSTLCETSDFFGTWSCFFLRGLLTLKDVGLLHIYV